MNIEHFFLVFAFFLAVPSRAPNISEIYYTSSPTIRVEWDPLSQEFVHGLLLGYHVVYRRVERGYSHIWNITVVGANDTGVTMRGLKKYGTYVIQVRAFNGKGDGKLTKGYMIRTDEDGKERGPTIHPYPRGVVTDLTILRVRRLVIFMNL